MFRISLVDTFYFAIHTDFEVHALDSAISLWDFTELIISIRESLQNLAYLISMGLWWA